MEQLDLFAVQPRVRLISHTQDALTLLLRTKNTRLTYADDPAGWPLEQQLEHLAYMRDTIKSSWEFVDYVFQIEGVTRAFTHQLVRTRTGSYAQQAMRVVDARAQPVATPPSVAADADAQAEWDRATAAITDAYGAMVDAGVPNQDARGILPTNVTTSIMAKFNLRTLHDMAHLRLCTRTQGEYQDVFRAMRDEVLKVHPWAEDFLQVYCVQHGACAFPRYGKVECPVYDPAMDNSAVKERAKAKFWSIRHEAAPIAVNGRAM
jgi:flavin-dependent thymidylate synthase